MRVTRHGGLLFAALALASIVFGGACRVDVQVDVAAERDGAGSVQVTASLDEAAADELAEVEGALRVRDLEAQGWTVDGPEARAGGGLVVRASKPFATMEDAAAVLADLSAGQPVFKELDAKSDVSFFRTDTAMRGVVDLSAGLATFSDPGLQDLLGGQPLGVDEAALEAVVGHDLADVFDLRLEVDLPGTMSTGGRPAAWSADLGERVPFAVEARAWNARGIASLVVAVVATASAVALVAIGARSRPRTEAREAQETPD